MYKHISAFLAKQGYGGEICLKKPGVSFKTSGVLMGAAVFWLKSEFQPVVAVNKVHYKEDNGEDMAQLYAFG